MATQSWYEENRPLLGRWAPGLEAFAARHENPNEYLRRVGRYVLWCIQNGHDSAQRNDDRVAEYLSVVRKLVDGRPLSEGTKRRVRSCISSWHQWLAC